MKANNFEINKQVLATGAILILIGIALGAFGAHGLKEKLNPEQLNSFEVGVRYQIYHGLALLILGFNSAKLPFSISIIYKLILTGVILFSGSIYILACKGIIGIYPPKIVYLITPLGGISLIAAWVLFSYQLIKTKQQKN